MRKIRFLLLIILVLSFSILALPAFAQAPTPEWNFVSVLDTSLCGVEGDGADVQLERVNTDGVGYYWDTIAESGGLILMDEIFDDVRPSGLHTWGIYNSNDRGQQTGSFSDVTPGATINVTITLRDTDGTTVLDTDTFSFKCGEAAEEETVEVATPGCDAFVAIPDSAVGAKVLVDTPVFWKPGEISDEEFPADLSLLATGLDASGGYYEVIYACGFYWLPAGAVGPNPESPWNGAPLPTDVVE